MLMTKMNFSIHIYLIVILILIISCSENQNLIMENQVSNILDFTGTPDSSTDRSSLAFSDQGAWFAYGFPDDKNIYRGFSGPFIMTQENGVWSSPSLSYLQLKVSENRKDLEWEKIKIYQNSYNSHLEQIIEEDDLRIVQIVFFSSPHTALIKTVITNRSLKTLELDLSWKGELLTESLKFKSTENILEISSTKSNATGIINFIDQEVIDSKVDDSSYTITLNPITLLPSKTVEFIISHTFIFPEYDLQTELQANIKYASNFDEELNNRIVEKEKQLTYVFNQINARWNKAKYKILAQKCLLTLQNNWRIPAGELKHSGLFPSYHYEWFHGFWAWDSWKHAVAIAKYNTQLAKEQIRAMFDFQQNNGFIADCVYRDTTIENHNYRNTKPPLSAWAVWKIYKQDNDEKFLKELLPKIINQHNWWYANRDYDKDSLCEYGSTDGTLIAAKWESGMDNAVRFDESKILKNSNSAYSLNQESVDLNSYLYAEKIYLTKIANVLKKTDGKKYLHDAEILKQKIQYQFYDNKSEWFYDTSIDGKEFIKSMGCEGWIPLWANAATKEQAKFVITNMMNPQYFNTFVPLQTLSASNLGLEPNGGYWRGPTWLDQSYFGVKGLLNYEYYDEAKQITKKLFNNAEGVLENGKSIRENYNPITGKGLESHNFSWSAAHYLLLLLEDFNDK